MNVYDTGAQTRCSESILILLPLICIHNALSANKWVKNYVFSYDIDIIKKSTITLSINKKIKLLCAVTSIYRRQFIVIVFRSDDYFSRFLLLCQSFRYHLFRIRSNQVIFKHVRNQLNLNLYIFSVPESAPTPSLSRDNCLRYSTPKSLIALNC